ncbi:RES domain-containing protein [Stenotrophomonas sp. NPDC078853]|uniref:RES domain-containing protein n=1 Tax=Stenotrophomonas sp. NPDC078853 TaxID=3364534 RepID=UPI00384EA7FB
MTAANRVCAKHIGETYLAGLIAKSVASVLPCSYCGSVAPTLTLEEIAARCGTVLENFYEPTGLAEKVVEYGADPDGDPLNVCLEELLQSTDPVVNDLSELILDGYECDPGENADPFFIRRHELGDRISVQWRRMSESLKNEARMFNPDAVETLEMVFGTVGDDHTYYGQGVIQLAGPGMPLHRLHRARVLQSDESLEHALEHPARELGPPPKGKGRAGRMNVAGVSVFYGATTASIALAEVRPPVGSKVLSGEFEITRELRLLDLDELSMVDTGTDMSLFDPSALEQIARCHFLSDLTNRVTMPVMPEDEGMGYIVTQAIADYLATNKDLNLDGIYFKSAQVPAHGHQSQGRNVVLFHKSSRVARAESIYREGMTAYLMEEDEDGSRIEPCIQWNGKEPARAVDWREHDAREVTLEVDLASLVVREVQAVNFGVLDHDVAYVKTA